MQQRSPSPIDVHIGSRVRARRVLLGLSQEKLAEALGLTFQQVQKYEKGANRIGASRLLRIAGILNVSIDFFFEDAPGLPRTGPAEDGAVAAFMNTPGSDRLMRGFLHLKDDETRKKVVDLVEWLVTMG